MKTWLSLLGICVLLGGLLSGTYVLTKPNIEANRTAAQRAALTSLVAPQTLPADLIWQQGYLAICEQLTLESVVANGYGGPMTLLMTYQPDACVLNKIPDQTLTQTQCSSPSLLKLVVSEHSETPGIGDFFETTHPAWLQQQPSVDSVSGATITATALRNAVAAALNVGTAIPFATNPCDYPMPENAQALTNNAAGQP